MKLFNNILSIVKKEQKNYLVFIFILIIITTVLETLSLASFYPLLDLILNNQASDLHQIQKIYYNFLG